jgi:DNA-binding NtrC family response regulator
VDDEPQVCHMVARILTEAGFSAPGVHARITALVLMATVHVDAVITDITMPGMSGLELQAKIAQRWPTLPVLLMSGQGRPPTGHDGPFLGKPFTAEALVAAVHDIMPQSAAQTH